MEILEKFLLYMQGNAVSERTIINYKRWLRYFFEYVNINSDEEVINIKQKDVVNYLQYLINDKKLEPQTRNTYLAAIKSLYTYLKSIEKVDIDIDILSISYIDTPKKEPVFLDEVEADNLMKKITDVRSRAIVGLLLKTGIRISELIGIKIEDMEKRIDEYNEHYYIIKIHGKGNKERYIYTDYELATWIDKYMGHRRDMALVKNQDYKDYLFLSNQGNKMNADNLRKMTKYWARKINFKYADNLSPHKLRHTYATLMLGAENYVEDENGNKVSTGKKFDIKTISESMGHSSINMTDKYAHTTQRRISDMQREGW